jgi:TPR repeat protein
LNIIINLFYNLSVGDLDQSIIDELWENFAKYVEKECELIIKFKIIGFIKKYNYKIVFEYLFNTQQNQNNQCLLGFFFYAGIGTDYDRDRALIFFSYAAEKGNKIARLFMDRYLVYENRKELAFETCNGTTNIKYLEEAICYEIENSDGIMSPRKNELGKWNTRSELYLKEITSWLLRLTCKNMKLINLSENEFTMKFSGKEIYK